MRTHFFETRNAERVMQRAHSALRCLALALVLAVQPASADLGQLLSKLTAFANDAADAVAAPVHAIEHSLYTPPPAERAEEEEDSWEGGRQLTEAKKPKRKFCNTTTYSLKGDYAYEACGSFCKQAKATNHCKCKPAASKHNLSTRPRSRHPSRPAPRQSASARRAPFARRPKPRRPAAAQRRPRPPRRPKNLPKKPPRRRAAGWAKRARRRRSRRRSAWPAAREPARPRALPSRSGRAVAPRFVGTHETHTADRSAAARL